MWNLKNKTNKTITAKQRLTNMPSIISQGSAVKKTFKYIFSGFLDKPVG